MEFTQEEKDLLINLLNQLSFKIGESATAQKYEALLQKIKEVKDNA